MTTVCKIAISYIRFSLERQALGDSLRRQTSLRDAFIKKHGLILDESISFRDLGVSGFRGANRKKGNLKDFVDLCESGRIPKGATLIVESLDRLSRDQITPSVRLIGHILECGINIATLEPERLYTAESANDLGTHIEIVVTCSRAHEESATKSRRNKETWAHKRKQAIAGGEKMSNICPSWLTLNEDRKGYRFSDRADDVRRIFALALDGKGSPYIAKLFNNEGIPSFGLERKSKKPAKWTYHYITRLLKDRSTIGECQPHVWSGKAKVPIGDPIPGYYPAVIDEDTFTTVQAGIRARYNPRGARERSHVNILRGMMFNALTGNPMSTQTYIAVQRVRVRIVDSTITNGGGGSKGSYLYPHFETDFLKYVSELQPEDFVTNPGDKVNRMSTLSSKLTLASEKIAAIQKAIAEIEDVKSVPGMIDMLNKIIEQREAAKKALDDFKVRHANPVVETLADVQSLAGLLATSKDPDSLRLKIRTRIRQLIESVWILIWDTHATNCRHLICQVNFPDGTYRQFATGYSKTPKPYPYTTATTDRQARDPLLSDLRTFHEFCREGKVIGLEFVEGRYPEVKHVHLQVEEV